MELNKQIKKYRSLSNLSQDELAEKVYVTRQTISNWETGKNYPDIHSLLLLSTVFDITLDQLMKGDLEMMKEEIRKEDIKALNLYSNILTFLFLLSIAASAPLAYYFKWVGFGISMFLFLITIVFSLEVEKFKKEKNIQTYKEIIAFANGERLDEISKGKEEAKKPYQKALLAISSGAITLVVFVMIYFLLTTLS